MAVKKTLAIRDIVTKLGNDEDEDEDDILDFTETELKRKPARYKFNENISPYLHKILELQELAERLTNFFFKK